MEFVIGLIVGAVIGAIVVAFITTRWIMEFVDNFWK